MEMRYAFEIQCRFFMARFSLWPLYRHRSRTSSAGSSVGCMTGKGATLVKTENAAVLTTYSAGEDSIAEDMPLRVSFGHASETRGTRHNEDFFGIVMPGRETLHAKGALLAIADGVSGGGGGRIAAEVTVRSLLADYYATPETWDIPYALDKVLGALNDWLVSQCLRRPELEGMFTTLSVLVLRGNRYYLAHVGDARIYRLRDGVLEQLTTDHVWPRRTMHHVLRRAVGLDGHLVIDFADGTIETGDVFLLLSDGVWEVLGNNQVHEIMQRHHDLEVAASELVAQAIMMQRRYLGGNDATAVVARVDACDG